MTATIDGAFLRAEQAGLRPRTRGKGFTCHCPLHPDAKPSLSVLNSDDGSPRFTCHAGCDWKELRRWFDADDPPAVSPNGKHPKNEPLRPLRLNDLARAKQLPVAFLRGLGVSDGHHFGVECVRIPYRSVTGGDLVTRYRFGNGEFRWEKGSTVAPYGLDRLHEARALGRITLVEGESDALTLWQAGEPALGIPGATTWKPDFARYLHDIPTIYAVHEPDPGGDSFVGSLADCAAIRDRLLLVRLPDGFKDPSALWCDDPKAFAARWQAALADAETLPANAAEEPPHPAESGALVAPVPGEPSRLADVMATFRRWLYLEDDGHIKVALAAYAANRMQGPPVWLMLVGGPSCGKTEAISAMSGLPYLHMESSLSGEAALLSGTPNKEKATGSSGGILRKLGSFGVLVLKDFTSILAMKHESCAPLLAALREVYDGSWTRSVGVDGGRTISWSGKVGMIAGCTPTIDSHHSVIGAMGERFVFYRLPVADAERQTSRVLDIYGQEGRMRGEMAAAVASLFVDVDITAPPVDLSAPERSLLIDLATLAVKCRSAVERDGRTREITLIPDAEAPPRLAGVLLGLLRGMVAVGIDRDEAWRLLAKVATDSMPALRWAAFLHAASHPEGTPIWTSQFATELRHPTVTVRRSLEELNAHGLLIRSKLGDTSNSPDQWELSVWARERYDRLRALFVPDCAN